MNKISGLIFKWISEVVNTRIRNNKESTSVMMPFELRGTALKPIKESH